MPTGIRKRRWFVVVAFLGVAAIGIFIGLLVRLAAYTEEMDRLNRFPSGLSQIQPLNLTRLWNSRKDCWTTFCICIDFGEGRE